MRVILKSTCCVWLAVAGASSPARCIDEGPLIFDVNRLELQCSFTVDSVVQYVPAGDKIVVTTGSLRWAMPKEAVSYDAETGAEVWRTGFNYTFHPAYPTNPPCFSMIQWVNEQQWDYTFVDPNGEVLALIPKQYPSLQSSPSAAFYFTQWHDADQNNDCNVFDQSGMLRWEKLQHGSVWRAEAVNDTILAVADQRGYVCFIDVRSGRDIDSIAFRSPRRVAGSIESTTVNTNGTWSIASYAGTVYVFDNSLTVAWTSNAFPFSDELNVSSDGRFAAISKGQWVDVESVAAERTIWTCSTSDTLSTQPLCWQSLWIEDSVLSRQFQAPNWETYINTAPSGWQQTSIRRVEPSVDSLYTVLAILDPAHDTVGAVQQVQGLVTPLKTDGRLAYIRVTMLDPARRCLFEVFRIPE